MEAIRDRFNGRERMDRNAAPGRYERNDRMCMGMDRGMDRGERPMRHGMPGEGGIKIEDVINVVERSNNRQLDVLADCVEEVKDEIYASEKEVLKALEESSTRPMGATIPTFDPAMKDELLQAILGNTAILNAIREYVEPKTEEPAEGFLDAEAEGQKEEKKDPLLTAIAEYFSNLEDHVHKENVKCYRNVQAALTEQTEQAVDQCRKGLGAIKVFSIITMVLCAANIAVLACMLLGII